MKDRVRKILAVLFICFCWAPQVKYLFPTPQSEKAMNMNSIASDYSESNKWIIDSTMGDKNNSQSIYREMWKGWFFYLFAITMGVVSGILAFFNRFKWRILLILSSLLYLYNWFFSGSTSSVSLIKSYELKWKTADLLGTYLTFIYKDVLLPITFIAIIILVVAKRGTSGKPVSNLDH